MKGHRYLDTGLWCINLCPNKKQTKSIEANNVYELCNTYALVNYLHKGLSIPTKSDLLKYFKKVHFVTCTGLMEYSINKHLKMTPATALGYAKKMQNIRSTGKKNKSDLEEE